MSVQIENAAQESLRRPEITSGLTLAQRAAALTIGNATQKGEADDAVFRLRQARDAIEAQKKLITSPLKRAMDAAAAVYTPKIGALDAAIKIIKDKLRVYMLAEEAKAQAERERQDALARAAAEEAAREAEAQGDDAPPPAQIFVPPPEPVRGNLGQSYVIHRPRVSRALDWAAAGPVYGKIDTTLAESVYRDRRDRGDLDPNHPLVMDGIEFVLDTSVGNRKA